jgi:hypothetical protein
MTVRGLGSLSAFYEQCELKSNIHDYYVDDKGRTIERG